jgi:hypothetical protein
MLPKREPWCQGAFNWSALASGVVVPGTTVATAGAVGVSGNNVFVGGNFKMVGGKSSFYIARGNDETNFDTPNPVTRPWRRGRQFRSRLLGVAGVTNLMQATTDFTSWTPVLTNSAGIYDFSDASATGYAHRLYRAILGR